MSQNYKLNEVMYLWFTQQIEKDVLLSGPIILEKAKMFEKLNQEVQNSMIVWGGQINGKQGTEFISWTFIGNVCILYPNACKLHIYKTKFEI